jgi:sugar/nucleoside kinase (ribokinase family)
VSIQSPITPPYFHTLVFIGLINTDIDIYPHRRLEAPGGAVYFAALAAAKLLPPSPIHLIARVGPDFDTSLLQTKINPEGLIIDQLPTTKSIQTYPHAHDLTQRKIQLVPGASLQLTPQDIPPKFLTPDTFFHLGTMPPPMQTKFVDFFLSLPQKPHFSIDTDVSFYSTPKNLTLIKKNLPQAELVFLNRREKAGVADIFPSLPQVIVKLDAQGSVYYQSGQKLTFAPAPPVKAPHPTGAGDTLAGTFLAAHYLQGHTIKSALQKATLAASYSLRRPP